jgi:hypothetical protein
MAAEKETARPSGVGSPAAREAPASNTTTSANDPGWSRHQIVAVGNMASGSDGTTVTPSVATAGTEDRPPSVAVGGASDANITAALGVPSLDGLDGLGAVGGGAHAEDEHVVASTMQPRAALLATLLAGRWRCAFSQKTDAPTVQ